MAGSDPGADAADAELRDLCNRSGRIACWLTVALVPAFGLLDVVAAPRHARLFIALRLVCVAVAVAVLWLLDKPIGRRRPTWFVAALAITVGLVIDAMTIFTGREASPYANGVNLVMLAMAVLMPWPARWMAAVSATLVGGFVAMVLATAASIDGVALFTSLSFLVATGLIATISTSHREGLHRREFAARRALAEAQARKNEFLAKMSHELRTPLHIIVGYADVICDGTGAAEAREAAARIRGQSLALHGMISDLLDFEKAEAGKLAVALAPVRVHELARQVADGFRPLAARKGLALDVDVEATLDSIVTDGRRVEQILTNLLGNAIKFTERGRVGLAVRAVDPADARWWTGFAPLGARPVSPAALPLPDPAVAFLVTDTGLGIRTEDLPRLAEDFEQIGDSAARAGGTGLGLSVSRRLAALLGGVLAVRSRQDAGSAFALVLPARPAAR